MKIAKTAWHKACRALSGFKPLVFPCRILPRLPHQDADMFNWRDVRSVESLQTFSEEFDSLSRQEKDRITAEMVEYLEDQRTIKPPQAEEPSVGRAPRAPRPRRARSQRTR